MNIEDYLESTYLKTKLEASLSKEEIHIKINSLVNEAIKYNFKLVMIRPDLINFVINLIDSKKSNLLVGTVIDFPLGDQTTKEKIKEATNVLQYKISDLDFVCDYNAFKRGDFEKFDNDIIQLSNLCIDANKTVKWIIETGALSKKEIFNISERISNIINKNFPQSLDNFFLKTSTGYYGGYGANINDIQIMRRASKNIKIKASGGIKSYQECLKMIESGVSRIGTSSAKNIYDKK